MNESENSNFFWPSFADLMTSLFFVMLVLYVLTVVILKQREAGMAVKAKQFERIQEIEKALGQLDTSYFRYDGQNKRYRLKVDVQFPSNSDNIYSINASTRRELVQAGRSLHQRIKTITEENPEVDYLLIIEGNTQWSLLPDGWNYKVIPNEGYKLSYGRALALANYWKNNGIDFYEIPNCEMMLVGSGYFGKSRDTQNEENNRRFSIQITAKVGELVE